MKQPEFVMYLAVLPKYRNECFRMLSTRLGSRLQCYASSAHLDTSVRTGVDADLYTRVRMLRLGRFGFIQLGHWLPAVQARTTVVDLNPRSISAWTILASRAVLRRRTLVWGHLYPQAGASARTAGLRRIMRQLAAGVLCYTHAEANRLRADGYENVWAAPNAIYQRVDIAPGVSTGLHQRRDVLYVGRFSPEKKVGLLVTAFHLALRERPEMRLVLVGDGRTRTELETQVRSLGIAESVTFSGWVDGVEELRDHYALAVCSASPGFAGLGLTQSLGFGVPQVVSRHEPHSPEIELAGTGGVLWANNLTEFTKKLVIAYDARDELPLIDISRAVQRDYSAESMADGLEAAMTEAKFGAYTSTELAVERPTNTGVPVILQRAVRALTRRLAIHENVTVGRDARIGRSVVLSSPHGLAIGDWVSIGPRTIIQCNGTVGDFTLIGMGVQIVGRDDHAIDEVGVPIANSTWVADRPRRDRDSVHIGRDVWIGGGSTVLSGVAIGDGAIIGSASVVTKDVEPFTIVAGNPARAVGRRFESEEEMTTHRSALDELTRRLSQQ